MLMKEPGINVIASNITPTTFLKKYQIPIKLHRKTKIPFKTFIAPNMIIVKPTSTFPLPAIASILRTDMREPIAVDNNKKKTKLPFTPFSTPN